jgi:phospholipid/cholesterol/gamma-HCH transport system substrate-binding protein
MRAARIRRSAVAAVAAAVSIGVAACSANGIYDVNLPGGADLGDHPYTVTAVFTDVLDLVRQSSVQVNDVAVGQVDDVSLGPEGKTALVKLEINGDVHLPANATASIQQTSLLGEKYVALAAPPDPEGTLVNGATIRNTSQGVQIEQIFEALSLLLTSGHIGRLHDIVVELNNATQGRTADVRALLHNADQVIASIDSHRNDIVAALAQVNALSRTLDANRRSISIALRDLPAGLKVLASQRNQLVTMLNALGRLSKTTVHTVRASQKSFVGDLKSLAPILRHLAQAGSALPQSLQVLLTYPFPDSVLQAIKGDYLNAFITQNLNSPGGSVVAPLTPQRRVATTPPALLPPVSSAAPGLPESTIVTTAPAPSSPSATKGSR